MTNRDTFNTEYNRKLIDLFDRIAKYNSISNTQKLETDKRKPDIDLVIAHEKKVLVDHIRHSKLAYSDFVKVPYEDEQIILQKINS